MIFIALGANLPGPFGGAENTLRKAAEAICALDLSVVAASNIWRSAPVPVSVSDQPWYKNAVVRVQSSIGPEALLSKLHDIEAEFGRVRAERNAPRVLDLDLIAYNDFIGTADDCIVPHPRMHERSFVLQPLREVVDDWVHPTLGLSLDQMISALPSDQKIERISPLIFSNDGSIGAVR